MGFDGDIRVMNVIDTSKVDPATSGDRGGFEADIFKLGTTL